MDTFELLAQWRVWLEANYAPKTVSMYYGVIIRFLADVGVPLLAVTGGIVDEWLSGYAFRSSARSTYYMALKSCYGWLQRNGHIEQDPLAFIRVPPREEKSPRALSVEQYEAVKAAAYKRAPIRGYTVELLYYSGGRIGEVLNLRWEDVDWDLETGGITFTKTKTGKDRVVPMSQGLLRALRGLHSHFGERTRVLPRASQTVWQWVREAGISAGVPDVHPHLFRSTSATRMMQRGQRVDAVQAVLGHTKLTTTSRYLELSREDKAKAVRSL